MHCFYPKTVVFDDEDDDDNNDDNSCKNIAIFRKHKTLTPNKEE